MLKGGGLVVSMLVFGSSVPGSTIGRGHCVIFKTEKKSLSRVLHCDKTRWAFERTRRK